MSLAELKEEAANLRPAERRELMAYLVWRQNSEDAEGMAELAAKIDDKDPSRWVDLKDLQKRYAE
jgi:hypothetical protein